MMNWTELRPKLRAEFKDNFTFYNDTYKSGNKRVKICCNVLDANVVKAFILEQDSELDVKIETLYPPFISVGIDYVMIRYNKI